jgi:uncharacterized membrane protein
MRHSNPHARQWTLAFLAICWVAAIFLAPAGPRQASASTLASACSAVVYAVGSVICHQRPERSFHLWGAQMPVCARCTGLYLGAALVALVALVISARRIRQWDGARARRLFFVAALPTALTLVVEWTTGSVPLNWVRAVSALPLGAIVAWLVLVEVAASRSTVEVN